MSVHDCDFCDDTGVTYAEDDTISTCPCCRVGGLVRDLGPGALWFAERVRAEADGWELLLDGIPEQMTIEWVFSIGDYIRETGMATEYLMLLLVDVAAKGWRASKGAA